MTLIAAPVSAEQIQARAEILPYYSPYHFLRKLPTGSVNALDGKDKMQHFGHSAGQQVLADGADIQWLLSHLPWDTEYFGAPTYSLFTGLFGATTSPELLRASAAALRDHFAQQGPGYVFSVVPTRDIALLQALTGGGWELVETRLTFYHDTIPGHNQPRYAVRPTELVEAAQIGRISASARNPYDRFHADPWFGTARADAFLSRYAEAATEGHATVVLVPAELGLPLDSFLAINDGHIGNEAITLETAFSRIILTAVGPLNRGWHLKLVSEALHRAREQGIPHVLMTTQSTNQTVFRTVEKLGFKLGTISHVFAAGVPLRP